MTSPTFFRWGGLALLVGCLVSAISVAITLFVPGPLGPSGPPPVWDAWLGAISGLIWLIGLPTLYTVQSKSAGLIGLLGIIGLFLAILLLTVVLSLIPAIAFANYVPPSGPAPSEEPPLFILILLGIGSLLLIAGAILFGIATLRTKVFASWTIWALIVLAILSTILFFIPVPVFVILGSVATILFMLLFAWYGYQLAFQTSTYVEVVAAEGSET